MLSAFGHPVDDGMLGEQMNRCEKEVSAEHSVSGNVLAACEPAAAGWAEAHRAEPQADVL